MSRRRWALLLALLLFAPALTGCLGGDDEDGDRRDGGDGGADGGDGSGGGEDQGDQDSSRDQPPRRPRQTLPSPFLLQGMDCREAVVTVPVDRQAAVQVLPEGFEPAPFQGPGEVDAPGDQAALSVRTVTCAQGGVVRTQAPQEPMAVHALTVVVQVPDELANPEAQADLYLVAAVTDQADVAQAFAERNWTVEQGETSLTFTETPVGAGTFQATGQGAGLASDVSGVASGANASASPGFLRIWHAPEDRLEYFHKAITSPHAVVNATGTVRGQPGSLTAELSGEMNAGPAGVTTAYQFLGTPVVVDRGSS